MKRLFITVFFIVFSFTLLSCTMDSIVIKTPFNEDHVKKAYVDSIIGFIPEAVKEEVEVIEIFKELEPNSPKEDKVRIVNVTSSYDIVPYKKYRETVEKLEFSYGKFSYYGYYDNKLYTIGELYKKRLIDMELVCELFSIYSESFCSPAWPQR